MYLRVACILLLGPAFAVAQDYKISTIAGYGTFGGDGGPATAALLQPTAVVVDANGNLYVSDPVNFRIRRIDASGTIGTVIGKSYSGFSADGGPSTDALMSTSSSLALDATGNLYFTDDNNHRVRKVTVGGTVQTVAGSGACGTVSPGMAATAAPLCDIESVAIDAQGRLYFASMDQIWTVATDGTLALIAGTGGTASNGDNGPAAAAQIGNPGSMVIDQNGNLYFADLYNFVIREVTADKIIHPITKIADINASNISLGLDTSGALYYVTGTAQVFKWTQGGPVVVGTVATVPPTGRDASFLAVDRSGAFFVTSNRSQRLLKIGGSTVTTIAGAYPNAVDPLPQSATNVRLILASVDSGLAVDAAGNVYFAELDNNLFQRIDKVTPSGTMSAVNAPLKLPGTNIDFTAGAVAFSPAGLLYFSTFTQVYRFEANGGVTLVAGAPGFPSNLGDGGPAIAAKITSPVGLAFDAGGNLYIAEAFDSRVRKVTPQGIISTFAGTGQAGYSGDGGNAITAKLAAPVDVKFDNAGNLYIADVSAAVVRMVNTNGIITTVAGNGTHGFSGDGGLATQAQLSGAAAIAVDPLGNIFISDRNQAGGTFVATPDNNRIRMVNRAGIISTIAGYTAGYNGEGIVSTSAAAGGPTALAADGLGNIYVADASTERIRKLSICDAATLSSVGQAFSSQGGTASIAITAGANCPWSIGPLPFWVVLTSPSSGVGNGTVTYQVSPNKGSNLTGSFAVGGSLFAVEQAASSIPGLATIGSLAQVASEGTWKFTLDAVNLGASSAQARFTFADNGGNPLLLPVTFPQLSPAGGPLLAPTLDRTISPNAQLTMESTGPDSASALIGWGQFAATANVNGFGIFSNAALHWDAVVPVETRNAAKYILAFDNSGALATGLAVANTSTSPANINVIIRDEEGVQLGTQAITLAPKGHTSFMLTSYPVTIGKRGTIEFQTPQGGQIGVLGLRANGPALTTLPVLASGDAPGGSIAHATYNGGFASVFYLVNTGAASADFTLSFFDEGGNPLQVPLSLPQSGATTTTSALTRALSAGAMLVVETEANDDLASIVGSAQIATTGSVSGFEIFRWTTFGQEASVPLETRDPGSLILVFDDTNGLTTGVALSNVATVPANVTARIYDDAGTLLQTTTISLSAHGHTSFLLPVIYGATANRRGMVEFVVPAGGKITAVGLRAKSDGTLTTIPVLTK